MGGIFALEKIIRTVMSIAVSGWRYEDGWRTLPVALGGDGHKKEFDAIIVGWFCQVRITDPETEKNFGKWLKKNMIGPYDLTFRFNSGNPYYSVWIKKDEDATLFKLTWL